jgi:hypothetical protein
VRHGLKRGSDDRQSCLPPGPVLPFAIAETVSQWQSSAMKLAIHAAALAASVVLSATAQAMSFSFVPIVVNNCTTDCPKAIVAQGPMYYDDIGTLIETIRAGIERDKNIRPVVILSSNGGNSAAGLQIGRIFRAIKATVIVGQAVQSGAGYTIRPGVCASACAFSLMGGTKRIVPDGSQVIVHWMSDALPQVYSGSQVLADTGKPTTPDEDEAMLRRFMREMGIRQDLAAFIRKVPNSSFHVMTTQEMTRFGLAQTKFR